jgi:hypothetical protein
MASWHSQYTVSLFYVTWCLDKFASDYWISAASNKLFPPVLVNQLKILLQKQTNTKLLTSKIKKCLIAFSIV